MIDESLLYALASAAQKRAVRARRRKVSKAARTEAGFAHAYEQASEPAYSPSQRAGRHYEEMAQQHLSDMGLHILARNLSCKSGEIDLVARDGQVLVFVEVRQRGSSRYGGSLASVDASKQDKLLRSARYFLPRLVRQHFGGRTPACRFDVIGVEPKSIEWIKNAFDER
jgi:putative endonuclease